MHADGAPLVCGIGLGGGALQYCTLTVPPPALAKGAGLVGDGRVGASLMSL